MSSIVSSALFKCCSKASPSWYFLQHHVDKVPTPIASGCFAVLYASILTCLSQHLAGRKQSATEVLVIASKYGRNCILESGCPHKLGSDKLPDICPSTRVERVWWERHLILEKEGVGSNSALSVSYTPKAHMG